MLLRPNMIKEYTCLPQSLATAQTLQTPALGSSQTAPCLLITNQAKTQSTYKQIIDVKLK